MVAKLTWMKAAIPLKTEKSYKKVERHIELRMELVFKVNKAGVIIKDKYGLMN